MHWTSNTISQVVIASVATFLSHFLLQIQERENEIMKCWRCFNWDTDTAAVQCPVLTCCSGKLCNCCCKCWSVSSMSRRATELRRPASCRRICSWTGLKLFKCARCGITTVVERRTNSSSLAKSFFSTTITLISKYFKDGDGRQSRHEDFRAYDCVCAQYVRRIVPVPFEMAGYVLNERFLFYLALGFGQLKN